MSNMRKPIKNFRMVYYPKGTMTQDFAENPALYAFMGIKGHNGQDHVAPHGSDMFAVEDGTVLEVKYSPDGFGRHLRFISNAKDAKGRYREWTYGHCQNIFVSVGSPVFAGQKIATMGNTGFVVSGATPFWKNNPYAGTHLHLGLRLVKRPRSGGWSYEKSKIQIEVVDYGNGFKGAIDPRPYLVGATDAVAAPTFQELQLTVLSLLNTVYNLIKK